MITPSLALQSEINEIEAILKEIPTENVIERLAFEGRLSLAKSQLEQRAGDISLEKARLTFRGRPVFGYHGIAADFGSKAAGAFADAFAAVVAGLNESLSYMGPIPDKAKNQLLITGTATGSFGFEFELPASGHVQDLFPAHDKGVEALQSIQSLLRVSASGTDDEVAELVEVIHPRAVKKVSEFLSYLAQQQAWCGLEFKDQFFRFDDINQLQRSAERLQESNIRESTETYTGELQGVLPNSRTFEFRLADQAGVIKGKVDLAVENPDLLNREWLHKPANVRLGVIQVGQGRPRFTLFGMADISAATSN